MFVYSQARTVVVWYRKVGTQFVHVCLAIEEVHQYVNQNVQRVTNVHRTVHVLILSVSIHALVRVALVLVAKS